MSKLVEYFSSSNVSQSLLKGMLIGFPKALEEETYLDEKRHFIVGSAIDDIITNDLSLDNIVAISSVLFHAHTVRLLLEIDPSLISDSSRLDSGFSERLQAENYGSKTWLPLTTLNKFKSRLDALYSYFYANNITTLVNKVIVTDLEYNKITNWVNLIRNHKYSLQHIWDNEGNTFEFQYQKAIYFEYEGVHCKALLDIVKIDHERKMIIPIDVKSMSGYVHEFPKSFRKFRYDIQSAWYTLALQQEYKDYKILPFRFFVVSDKSSYPLIYKCSEKDLHIGKWGYTVVSPVTMVSNDIEITKSITDKRLGYEELLLLYKIRSSECLWDEHFVSTENSGMLCGIYDIIHNNIL